MRHSPVLLAAALAALDAAGHPASAQQAAQLRYAPVVGSALRTLTERRTVTTLTGFPALPDGSVLEEETRLSATQTVREGDPAGVRVDVTVDSVWGRRRMSGGAWKGAADSSLAGRVVRTVLSPRLTVSPTGDPVADAILATVYGSVAGPGFGFPESPLAAGSTFATGTHVAARVQVPAEAGLDVDETVSAELSLTVDSLQRTDADELAFLSFAGSFVPRTTARESESGSALTALAGGYAGRLVWSRAWNAFVSGVARVRVDGTFSVQSPGGTVEARAVWETTIRHQIRP